MSFLRVSSVPLARRRPAGLWCATLLLTAACASTAPDVAPAPVMGVPLGTPGARGIGLETTRRTDGVTSTLDAAAPRVLALLESAYTQLQIPLTFREPARGTIGNQGYKFRRRLANMEARKLFECGGTSGMPNAETYTITMAVTSSVRPVDNGHAQLLTVVEASAQNPNFPGSGVSCTSTGMLEERIASEVRNRLAAPQSP